MAEDYQHVYSIMRRVYEISNLKPNDMQLLKNKEIFNTIGQLKAFFQNQFQLNENKLRKSDR